MSEQHRSLKITDVIQATDWEITNTGTSPVGPNMVGKTVFNFPGRSFSRPEFTPSTPDKKFSIIADPNAVIFKDDLLCRSLSHEGVSAYTLGDLKTFVCIKRPIKETAKEQEHLDLGDESIFKLGDEVLEDGTRVLVITEELIGTRVGDLRCFKARRPFKVPAEKPPVQEYQFINDPNAIIQKGDLISSHVDRCSEQEAENVLIGQRLGSVIYFDIIRRPVKSAPGSESSQRYVILGSDCVLEPGDEALGGNDPGKGQWKPIHKQSVGRRPLDFYGFGFRRPVKPEYEIITDPEAIVLEGDVLIQPKKEEILVPADVANAPLRLFGWKAIKRTLKKQSEPIKDKIESNTAGRESIPHEPELVAMLNEAQEVAREAKEPSLRWSKEKPDRPGLWAWGGENGPNVMGVYRVYDGDSAFKAGVYCYLGPIPTILPAQSDAERIAELEAGVEAVVNYTEAKEVEFRDLAGRCGEVSASYWKGLADAQKVIRELLLSKLGKAKV